MAATEADATAVKLNAPKNFLKKPVNIGKNVDERVLRRMPTVLRSKFQFYVEPSSKISDAQSNSQKRLNQQRKERNMEREKMVKKIVETTSVYSNSMANKDKKLTLEEKEEIIKYEKERHDRLVGQLKAAEARNRTRILKLRYFNSKEDEIDHLIDSQPNALKAVRLQAFLPPVKPDKSKPQNDLNPIQRRRLEALIEDTANSLIERKLY
jgi:hypothetical protein